VPAELHRLIRAFGLFWGRLGSARVYVAAIAGVVVILAAIGIWHLVSSQPSPSSSKQSAVARISPGAERSLTPPGPTPAAAPAEIEGQVEITKIEQTEKKGPRGETFVVATIGLASRTNVEKNGVEIHVYFYDLTADNEIRPTDAQVTYQWVTAVRDWNDPTPKYLAATYFKPPVRQRSIEKLHYGGFVVRVFSGGKLQDEKSHPEALLTLFRNNASEQTAAISPPPNSSPRAILAASTVPPQNVTSASPTAPANSPTDHSPLVTDHSSQSLPYGKPIPGKPGFLYSPYDPKFIIDVRGFPPGTLVNDPNTNKPFRVP
jgi:hypothetical protein